MVTWSADSSRVPREQQLRDSLIRAVDGNGATPSTMLDLLDVVVTEDAWRRLRDQRDRSFDRFRDFITAPRPYGIGMHDKEELTKLLALQHKEEREPYRREATVERMAKMRAKVGKLLCDDIEPELAHGGDRRGPDFQASTTSLKATGNATTDSIVARLKRDAATDPRAADLYAKVAAGEVRPNRAARDLGWRKPRIVLSNPALVAARLREHFPARGDREEIARLLISEVPDAR